MEGLLSIEYRIQHCLKDDPPESYRQEGPPPESTREPTLPSMSVRTMRMNLSFAMKTRMNPSFVIRRLKEDEVGKELVLLLPMCV
jgi:hypothetical protein